MQNTLHKTLAALTLSAAIALPALYHTAQAAPRRGGSKTSSTTSTTTTTGNSNRPAPTPGARDVKMLEAALGRALTDAEIAAITAAATARKTASDAANTTFQNTLVSLFNLDSSQSGTVATAAHGCHDRGGDVLSALVTALGRALTSEEIAAVNTAQATRDAALTAAFADYKTAVAAAVGLSVDELDAKIQAARPADGGPGGGRGRR